MRLGKDSGGGDHFSGSLVTAVLQKLGPSEKAENSLIHHLLVDADIASWGIGISLTEFAQKPGLVRELRKMLQDRYPGSLSVSRDLLRAGQKEILGDAMSLSFYYLLTPRSSSSEVRNSCWVIRDFGTDEQFGRLLAEISISQYQNQHRYAELWNSVIWSDNARERAVLEILQKDQRIYQPNLRYSDIANGELTRIKKQNR